jgi:hypothetical protein
VSVVSLKQLKMALKQCVLHPAEREVVRKTVFPELDVEILRDITQDLGTGDDRFRFFTGAC